jgi:single-strand DNA-binding protein
VNSVTLIGNLATEVDFRELSAEKRVANFLLAVERGGEGRGADFIRIVAWDAQADTCTRFLAKGRRVEIDGRLRSRSFEDKEGKRRNVTEVVASRVQALGPSGATAEDVPFEAAAAS